MQLKLGHGYFKLYLTQLPDYLSKKHYRHCHGNQNLEHLLTKCIYFVDQQLVLIQNIKPLLTTLKTLYKTNVGVKNLVKYLKSTKLATRK